jgi:hypothetical protein
MGDLAAPAARNVRDLPPDAPHAPLGGTRALVQAIVKLAVE